jgi:hypothetical protein
MGHVAFKWAAIVFKMGRPSRVVFVLALRVEIVAQARLVIVS